MRKIVSCVLVCMFAIAHVVCAEGLLPTLTDAYGIPMPSLGDVLLRYPDTITDAEDGSSVETWYNVAETDFEDFSVYLESSGAALQEYAVTDGVFDATIEKDGCTFLFSYDPGTESAVVTYPKGTYDGREFEAHSHYNAAKGFMNNGDYIKACSEFLMIPNYKLYLDVDSIISNNEYFATTEAASFEAKYAVGNVITFGTYPQSSEGTDKTQIEWLVLRRDGPKALLISKYLLDSKPYNAEMVEITWEKCTLRKWLNDSFLNTAFTAVEQRGILTTQVDNSKSQGDSEVDTNGGNDTQDKIFLLSYSEAWTYFSSDDARKCALTDYALKQGAGTNDNFIVDGRTVGWWWLRSPGNYQECGMCVSVAGDFSGGNAYSLNHGGVSEDGGCIRPALWVNLESGIF